MDIQDVKRLTLGPDDRLLITLPGDLDAETFAELADRITAALSGIPVLVITDQINVSVVADEENP